MKRFVQLVLAIGAVTTTSWVFADGAIDVSMRFAGYNYDTAVDVVEDGIPVDLTDVRGKGTFGNSSLAGSVEFIFDDSVICPEGYDVPAAVLDVPDHYWAILITAANLDQVYGYFDSGYLCFTADLVDWVGVSQGFFSGGTGHYEGATGTWVLSYSGRNLEPSIGLRSMSGELEGTLYLD